MSKGLPVIVKDNLEKCRSTAIAAVDVYNRAGPSLRTAHYIVLIVIAWTGFFHAIFCKKRLKAWYRKKGNGTNPKRDRYDHVDGATTGTGIAECLCQYYGTEKSRVPYRTAQQDRALARLAPPGGVMLYQCYCGSPGFSISTATRWVLPLGWASYPVFKSSLR
jgi:hypothetical protein